MNSHTPEVRRLLRQHGVLLTPQRIEVGEVLLVRPQHLSAEQILETLRRAGSLVSKATVYNTLNLFVERGLVQAVHVDRTRTYYDSTTSHHHHIYNVDTGELTDISNDDVVLERLPQLPTGTVADGIQVVVRVRNKS